MRGATSVGELEQCMRVVSRVAGKGGGKPGGKAGVAKAIDSPGDDTLALR
jgi:hypothetical protein